MKKLVLLSFALLTLSVGSMAQTITYQKQKLTYSKVGDVTVTVNDAKQTKIVFKTVSAMPTASQVLAEYTKLLATPPVIVKPPVNSTTVIPISGKTTDLGIVKSNIVVKPGIYENVYFTFQNANDVQIDFTGVTFKNSVVEIGSGNNVTLLNLVFDTQKYRPLRFDFGLSNLTIKEFTFINCDDYVISSNGNKDYNGNNETLNTGLKILNSTFDNCGTINLGNSLDVNTGEDKGLFKDVEIAYNTFKNSSPGAAVSFSNVWGYDIHHNVVDNFNTLNNNHNGVFFMQGNGKFHDNKLTNYQGNSIRMWLYSRGSTPFTNEIYNNFCFNTRKYGAFELQQFERNLVSGKSTYADAKVYGNTVGQMNTAKDWEGQILDLYNLSGSIEYYNNLGFNLNTVKYQSSVTNMINNMSNTKITREENNKYFSEWNLAVKDLTSFETKFKGIGASF